MKYIVNDPASEGVLDASGASYKVDTLGTVAPASIAVLGADGSSFVLSVQEQTSYDFLVLDSNGASYKLTTSVINKPSGFVDIPRIYFSTPISYTSGWQYDETTLDVIYKDLPPADIAFSLGYSIGLTRETVARSISFTEGLSYTKIQNLDIDYHFSTGVDTQARDLKFIFTPSYGTRIESIKSISFDIYKRLTASRGISYNSLNSLKAIAKVSYTAVEKLQYSLPLSYQIVATVYRVLKVSPASYSIKPNHLTKVEAVSYNSFTRLAYATGISYDVNLNRLRKSTQISYNSLVRLVATTHTSYVINAKMLSYVKGISYNSADKLVVNLAISYNVRESLLKVIPISFTQHVNLIRSIPVSYNAPERFSNVFKTGYEIRNYDRLQKVATLSYFSVNEITTVINTPNSTITLPDGSVVPSGNTILQSQNIDVIEVEPLLIINGELIYVLDMSVTVDEGNYTYSVDATLANYADMVKFSANAPFFVVLQGEVYSFVVDSRSISREEVNAPQAKLRGLSPTSKFTSPRSKQIIGTTFSEAYTAHEIANHLLYDSKINYTIGDSSNDLTQEQANAITLNWEIQDWGIPPYRYGVENTYPLDGLKTIVEAVGGVVEATPEGNIRARYKFPVRVPDYDTATPDHVFTDANDIISIQEHHSPNRMVNAVYVKTFQDMGIQDTLEFFDALTTHDPRESTTGSGGIVRVFPAIWRDTVDLSHNRNGDTDVYLEYEGIEDYTPDEWIYPDFGWETIQIVKGQGSTKYPLTKVLGYGYMSDNAGDIIINDYSKTFYTKDENVRFSILKLKYQTRCHRWKLTAPGGTHIQFKIADTIYNTYLR